MSPAYLLGPSVEVHTLKFEDFESDKRFDMCLFAESFHYIELEPALRQAARYARDHILIFDYFRRPGREYEDATRGSHAEFVQTVGRLGDFEIVSDEDMTEGILPTFYVLDQIKNVHFAPFVGRFEDELRRNHPVYSALSRMFLGKVLRKLKKRSTRHQTFADKHEYRLILLSRKA